MNPFRPMMMLYAVWCIVVLAVFGLANNNGYSAFAGGGRSTPMGLNSGPHHK